MNLSELQPGELAAVVTFLEMHQPSPEKSPPPSPLRLCRLVSPEPERYRTLFRLVGARWLWFSRLMMKKAPLQAILSESKVEIHSVLDESGGECGMLELDFRTAGECELAYVGLVPELSGRGHGRWLLHEALKLAWRDGVERVHVHTCTLDHPAALPAYLRAGFSAYRRAIERFPDPRLLGLLPRDCAPQVPLLGTDVSTGASPVS